MSFLCSIQAFSADLKKHMFLSEENNLCDKQDYLSHSFPVRLHVVLNEMPRATSSFQYRDKISLFKIGLSC
jgi:hypothetical protein